MSVRRLVAAAGAAAVVAALPIVPSYAAVTTLYVEQGGDDTNDCLTSGNACATVDGAISKADPSGTTIQVGPGTFDGPVRPGAFNRSVTIDGAGTTGPGATILTSTGDPDDTVVYLYGTTTDTLSNLQVSGGLAGGIIVADDNAVLHVNNVVGSGGGCDLFVSAGSVDVTDSTFMTGGVNGGGCGTPPHAHLGDVAIDAGSLSLTRVSLLDPAVNGTGLAVHGGTATVDQSYFDSSNNESNSNNSRGVYADAGQVTLSRSTITGYSTGAYDDGASFAISDSTFTGNAEGVASNAGAVSIVRSTFSRELGSLLQQSTGTIGVAGSLIGVDDIASCAGTVTDWGYNVADDHTCDFSASTSTSGNTSVDSDLSDVGGPVPTLAIRGASTNPEVDQIPVGATYGTLSAPLCPSSGTTDIRGVARPQGGSCDVGSMEMVGTTTTMSAPAKAAPHASTALSATVTTGNGGDTTLGTADGSVTFSSGTTTLCSAPVTSGAAGCSTTGLAAGKRSVVATFVPGSDALVDGSASATHTVLVGTKPAISGPARVTVHGGKKVTITLKGTGAPAPALKLSKGKLPAGLKFKPGSGKATISGTPKASAAGKYVVRVTATNIMGSVTHTLTIIVKRS